MIQYLHEVDRLIQSGFGHWMGILFLWVFLTVSLGYYITNVSTYRDQRRRAVEEWRYLRRRLFSRRDHRKEMPFSEFDWIDIEVWFDDQLIKFAGEMEACGFNSTANLLREGAQDIHEVISTAREIIASSQQELIQIEPDRHRQRIDDIIRTALRNYFRSEHEEHLRKIAAAHPLLLELINAPTFAKWQRKLAKR